MPNKLSQFWQELKRRNVIRVITVYAGAAFVIIELINNITEPLRLPDWTPALVIVLLAIGFPIVIIFSWLYDIHPEGGMVKTVPAEKVQDKDAPISSNNWKIASYISFVVIVGLIVLNIIPRTAKKEVLEKSIAVLPFNNLSSDQQNTYFIDGMMESILDNLCKIEDLRVPGRTSVMLYRENPKPIPVVAEEMDVAYVLEGSGQKIGNRLLLTVQLIIGNEDRHIWSKQYDREIEKVEDLMDIQREVARLIALEIEAIITPEEGDLINKSATTNLTAYDFYIRGREEFVKYQLNKEDRQVLEKAKEYFDKALDYDSSFAQAFTGLAWVYWEKNFWEDYFSENVLDSVIILADLALSYDSELSEAYTIKGKYHIETGEPEQGLEEYKKALMYNPNDWMAYQGLAEFYTSTDLVKTIEYCQKAILLNRGAELPELLRTLALYGYMTSGFAERAKACCQEILQLNGDTTNCELWIAYIELYNANFDKALEIGEGLMGKDPSNVAIQSLVGFLYVLLDRPEDAFEIYQKYVDLGKIGQTNVLFDRHRIGWAYWQKGYYEEARGYFNEQIEWCIRMNQLGRGYSQIMRTHLDLAISYSFLGESDKACEILRSLVDNSAGSLFILTLLRHDPLLDPVRDEPQFQRIQADAEVKYQDEHESVRKWLEENDML